MIIARWRFAFGTTSETAIGEKKIAELREGYKFLLSEAVGRGLAHSIEVDGQRRSRVGQPEATAA